MFSYIDKNKHLGWRSTLVLLTLPEQKYCHISATYISRGFQLIDGYINVPLS